MLFLVPDAAHDDYAGEHAAAFGLTGGHAAASGVTRGHTAAGWRAGADPSGWGGAHPVDSRWPRAAGDALNGGHRDVAAGVRACDGA